MENAAYCIRPAWSGHRRFTKILLIVKLSIILMTVTLLHVEATGLSQSVTLSGKNLEMKQVLAAIKKQTGYVAFYKKGLLDGTRPVTLSVQNMPLAQFLELCLKDQPLTYLILDKTISLSGKPAPVAALPAERTPVRSLAPPPVPITGRILDADGKPLIGASISVKNSRNSTISGADGTFTLNVNEGDVLVISYVGFVSRQMTISAEYLGAGKKPLSFRLQPSDSDLDQVQVTAHGTTTKRLNPGDITTITATEIEKNPVNNVFEAIQGKVPGLFIQQMTGQPGGAFTLRLRGSLNFSTGAISPLVVVDGVRYPASTLNLNGNTSLGTLNYLGGGNGLNYLNPNDIASIDILKDADATAIYGSSGAYGVILITTKKAKVTAPTFNANIYTGVSVNGQMPKLMNTQQYVMLREEALKNDGLTVSKTDLDINGTWPQDQSTDWRKVYMGAYGQSTNANLSYSGGGKYSNWMIGGNLRNNDNIQRHNGSFGDGSLRFSLNTTTADNKLELDLSGNYLSSKSTMVPFDFSSSSALDAPNAPSPFLPNGSVDWSSTNPDAPGIAANINRNYKLVTTNVLSNATLVYKPVTGVTLRAILGFNDLSGKELIEIPTTTFAPTFTQAAQQTHSVYHYYDNRMLTFSPYAEYDRTLWKKGDLSVKVGGEIDNGVNYWNEISGTGFPSDALLGDPAAGSSVTSSFNQTPFRALGSYAIVKYVWDRKYILDLNGRRDGSTRFGPDHRFGNFGSVAAAWIFSEENFIKEHASFLSFGKLRASTGVIGGDAISDYSFLSLYQVVSGTYDGKLGLNPASIANPDLQWEKNRDQEIGLELGFLKDRVYVEGNYYRDQVSNQLVARPISTVTGFGSFTLNSDAVIRNSGWEMSLSTTNIKTRDFSWTTRFNISIPTSKLLRAPTQANQNTNYVVGKPLTGILLYKYAGVDSATGYFSFTNAKGVTGDYNAISLSQTDKTQFIDLAPKFFGGFQNSFTYRQFTLDVTFTFTDRIGKNALSQSSAPVGYFDINGTTDWLRRWQKPGDKTDMPRVSSNVFYTFFGLNTYGSSTGAYTNATYARLQNLSFRYHFDPRLLNRMHIRDCTIYLQGQNLLTISHFGGLDPENLSPSVIPPLRVFTAGINFTL